MKKDQVLETRTKLDQTDLTLTKRSINGTIFYKTISNAQDEFREFIFKVYIKLEESLIQKFEKEIIVLIVECYVYKEKIKYVHIIKSLFCKKK